MVREEDEEHESVIEWKGRQYYGGWKAIVNLWFEATRKKWMSNQNFEITDTNTDK